MEPQEQALAERQRGPCSVGPSEDLLSSQKTLQNCANQEVQILVFTLRTLKLNRSSRLCISKEPPSV